jgi:hypothetical protein
MEGGFTAQKDNLSHPLAGLDFKIAPDEIQAGVLASFKPATHIAMSAA